MLPQPPPEPPRPHLCAARQSAYPPPPFPPDDLAPPPPHVIPQRLSHPAELQEADLLNGLETYQTSLYPSSNQKIYAAIPGQPLADLQDYQNLAFQADP